MVKQLQRYFNWSIILLTIVSVLGGSGHQASAQEQAPEDSPTYGESYIVGLDDTFAPMGFRDAEGNIVGFDIDLANAVAEIYNWDLTFQAIDWSLKETELNSGSIDMIWNGYGVTPQREEQVLMSEPYIHSGQVIVTKEGSGIESLEDLEGKTIATQSGSTAIDFMKNWPNDLYNRLAEEPTLYPDYNQVFADLSADRVDAIYAGGVYARYVINQRDDADQFHIFDDETSNEPMAVGMRFEDTDLKEAIDNGLATLKENGTFDEIYAKWFGEDTNSEVEETSLIAEIMPALLDGLKLTLGIFAVVLIVSLPLGLLIALLRVFGPKWLQVIIEAYVFIMRGTPLMLQLMVFFFGLPFIGVTLDRIPAALLAFIINYAAYFTEIFRGGINSVPKGQFESISVLGIGRVRGFIRIILPQVFNIVMPSIGNEVIALIKDTSLVYVIGIGELLRAGSIAANREASLMPYVAVGAIYLLLTAILTFVLRRFEKTMKW